METEVGPAKVLMIIASLLESDGLRGPMMAPQAHKIGRVHFGKLAGRVTDCKGLCRALIWRPVRTVTQILHILHDTPTTAFVRTHVVAMPSSALLWNYTQYKHAQNVLYALTIQNVFFQAGCAFLARLSIFLPFKNALVYIY